jgi:hypothetical protein
MQTGINVRYWPKADIKWTWARHSGWRPWTAVRKCFGPMAHKKFYSVWYVLARVTTRQPPDAALPLALSVGQCQPSATLRVPSVNGPQDTGQPQ